MSVDNPRPIYPCFCRVVDHKGYSVWLTTHRVKDGPDIYLVQSLN